MTPGLANLRPLPGMLAIAIQAKNLPAVKHLLVQGARPDDKTSVFSPMYIAVREAGPAFVRALLDAGAEVNAEVYWHKDTALHLAVIMKDAESVQLLRARGARTDLRDMNNATPADYAREDEAQPLRQLLEAGTPPEPSIKDPVPPASPFAGMLFWAANHGHLAAVEELLRCGADPRIDQIHNGESALHQACNDESPAMARALLDAGADVNAQQRGGDVPLSYAVWEQRLETVRLLLSRGADMGIRDNDGHSPRDYAEEQRGGDVRAILDEFMRVKQRQAALKKQQGLRARRPGVRPS